MSGLPVLLFLDVSGGELIVILLVVFLVFGPEKMPDMARKAGRLMNQMKKATNDLTNEFKKETSVVRKEINEAHSKVDDQVDSVKREFSRTKSQVVDALNTNDKPATNVLTELPVETTAAEAKPPSDESAQSDSIAAK